MKYLLVIVKKWWLLLCKRLELICEFNRENGVVVWVVVNFDVCIEIVGELLNDS